jgi:hypothetical protein
MVVTAGVTSISVACAFTSIGSLSLVGSAGIANRLKIFIGKSHASNFRLVRPEVRWMGRRP